MSEHNFPFARPFYVMLKPAGALCNLACEYCYYLEKKALPTIEGSKYILSDELLEEFTKQYIRSQSGREILFTWHGGEALLRPISFYRKALEFQRKYAGGHMISNALQTNGTLITDEWAKFLKENNFLVGISIDGDQCHHDHFRRTPTGLPSHHKVMKGLKILQKYGVEYNAMAVLHRENVEDPEGFYEYMKHIDCHYIQFAPIVERVTSVRSDGLMLATAGTDPNTATMTEHSITADQWGEFLCRLFDLWVKEDVGTYFIQLFDSTLANWVGVQPGTCILGKYCGHAAVMEHNGDVYSCDHFVFPEYKLGNIKHKTLVEMMESPVQHKFGLDKYDVLPRQCKECDYLFACWGECPKNRFVKDEYGEPGLNYLCRGYYRFFKHVSPYMDYMKSALDHEQPPASIMDVIRETPDFFHQ